MVGEQSVVLGKNAASAAEAIAIGDNAKVNGRKGVAVGIGSESSSAGWATAIGSDAKATGGYSVALGNSAKAKELQTIAIGNDSESSGGSSVAVGTRAKASGGASIAMSQDANASGESSMAFGISSVASGGHTIAIGSIAKALSTNAIAIGSQTIADKDNSVAVGPKIQHIGTGAAAVGAQANATGNYSVAMGNLVNVDADWNKNHPGEWRNSGDFSVALGSQSGAWGAVSTAVGALSKAEGDFANAIGSYANASGNYTNAMGLYSAASADYTNAMGIYSVASADYANAIGSYAKANVEYSVALGSASVADREAGVVGAFAPEGADSLTWRANGGAVSVGSDTLTRQITNVAAGTEDTDAVNVAQLKKVNEEARKHSVVTEGANITVTPEEAEDGRMQYNVALNNDIFLSGDNDAFVDISGSKGTIWASGSVAAGNVIMDGTTATVSGLGNTTTAYDGFANGEGKAATEEQLKEIGKVADNANQGWKLSTNGGEASKVAPGETVDFSGDKNITISNDGTNVKVKLNENIDVNSVQTNALNSKYNLSVGTMAENGIMPFFVNSTGAFYAAHNKFSVDKDGNVNANSVQTNALNSKYNLSVGTMAENGIMPFFVNSTGAFYAANNNFSVDKDGKVIATAGEIGNVVLNNGVFTGHSALRDGELFVGDASGSYSQITTKGAKLGQVVIAEDGKISNVAAGVADTDAVNVGQLKEAVEAGNTDTHIKPGEYGVGADNTVNMDVVDKNGNKVDTVTIKDVAKASDVGDVNNIASDIKNGEGHTNVVDAVNNLNNKVGDLQYSKVEKGEIADGDSTTTAIGKLDQKLTDVAATAAKHTKVINGTNISVEETDVDGQKNYKVNLNKDIILGDLTGKNVSISGTNGTIETTGYIATKDRVYADKGAKLADIDVTGNKISNGASSIVLDGSNVKVNDKVTIDQDGKISGVAAGEVSSTSTDAINGSQLHQAKADINNRIDGVENQVINNTNNINKLGSRVNKVGAGAAALAALHPMDFDPDDKLTFSAGYGNYAGENAAAIGAYYRPDEKVMFSVAGTVGNGENMVNAGVSFALDRTNHVSNSRTALAREVIDLRGQLAVMGAKMAKMEKAFGMLDETKTKLFPDVPANHWAYEYIAKLAGNGYIEGYPDGNFGGDRLMTRYEFAAMLYRAIENGAALEEKIIKEFEPELGRIRVDRISGEDGDRDKIERVRVNDTKGERDHYGNKLAK